MIILVSLILLMSLGIFLLYKNWECDTEIVGVFLTIFPGIFLIIALISLITNFIEVKSNINKFLAAEATIEIARRINYERIDELSDVKTIGTQKIAAITENTAIQHKIIECNQWLAKQQYYNSTIFELWVPDEIDKLKPIR